MFREILQHDDAIVGLVCERELSTSDLREMHELLHERLAGKPNLGLLLHMKDWTGYQDMSAMVEDLKMDLAHLNDFSRIAVVGGRSSLNWGNALAQYLTLAEMQWFDANDIDQATNWVRGGYEYSTSAPDNGG
ncbi:MAG: STAS/SEC14 domain-containing protein [Devosia marina]|uniref:STAS/SEC14 domain-containing protein n=1 Tax=Devosia marina TaxID=2683198 RepID=UPI0032EBCE1B